MNDTDAAFSPFLDKCTESKYVRYDEVSVIRSVPIKVYEKGVRTWGAQEGDMNFI